MNTFPLKIGMIVRDTISSMTRTVSSEKKLVCSNTDPSYPSHHIGETYSLDLEEWQSIDTKRWCIVEPKEDLFEKLYLTLKCNESKI